MSTYGYESYGYSTFGNAGSYGGGYSVYTGPFLDAYGSASVGHPGYASDTTEAGVSRTSYFYDGYDRSYYRHDTNSAGGYYAQTTRYSSGYGNPERESANTSYYRVYDSSSLYDNGGVQNYYRDLSQYSISQDGASSSYRSYTDLTTFEDGSSYFVKDYSVDETSSSKFQSHRYDITASTNSYGYTTYTENTF